MKKNNKEKSNKKKIMIVLIISLFTILGGTLAYFTTSDTIKNIFQTALYQHKIVEKFVAPSDWTPGTTTNKTITITNNGSIDMALRASYTEKWVNGNGTEISLKDSNNNTAAIIHFNNSWTKGSDGYYYYGSKSNLTRLKPNETSSSFISGVTFNENIKTTLNKAVSEDGKTITYTSSGNGYDRAQYILTITIDTIQYDQANNVW
ncbi:MAG: hypothetical protein E7170_04090 [Firmicutes bacterium]|nr:hypothetical protein [Bacillota bacterium]